jgi:predicted AlkP superfamily phosphohydrolase/phosphomutase
MLNFSDVDWTRTAAYAFGSSYVGAIYLNLVGRRPEGIIMPGVEADRIKESISAELRKLVDLNSEKKLIKEVLKAEDLYTGPHTADAPDLIVFLNDAEYETFPATMMLRCKELIQATPNAIASHRRKGLLIIRGKGINAGISISEPSIIDLAPTILHILGEPIPTDMDGKVLRSCFVEGGHLSTKAQFDDVEVGGRNHSAVYSDEEEVLVLNRLRELGYID